MKNLINLILHSEEKLISLAIQKDKSGFEVETTQMQLNMLQQETKKREEILLSLEKQLTQKDLIKRHDLGNTYSFYLDQYFDLIQTLSESPFHELIF